MKRLISIATALLLTTSQFAQAAESAPRDWDGKKPAKVTLIVKKDMMSGYNVQIRTLNFKWAPEHASMAHIAGEGHAHIYVDGVKIGRVYGQWFHLNTASLNLTSGDHTILVNLNGNDHRPYVIKGVAVEAKSLIKIS